MAKRDRFLTHERLLVVAIYNQATGMFYPRQSRPGCRPCVQLGHVDRSGYRTIMIDGHKHLAHRLAWFYVKKVWPTIDIDHRDLARDHNAIDNLREATDSQNHANARAPASNTSGLKGACWNRFRGYWQSYIKVNGRNIFLGRFNTKEEAHSAYAAAAIKHQGEFARAA